MLMWSAVQASCTIDSFTRGFNKSIATHGYFRHRSPVRLSLFTKFSILSLLKFRVSQSYEPSFRRFSEYHPKSLEIARFLPLIPSCPHP